MSPDSGTVTAPLTEPLLWARALLSTCVTQEPILSSESEALRGLVTSLRQHSLQAGPSGLRPQPRSAPCFSLKAWPKSESSGCCRGPSLPPSPRPSLSAPDQAWAGSGPRRGPSHPCEWSQTRTLCLSHQALGTEQLLGACSPEIRLLGIRRRGRWHYLSCYHLLLCFRRHVNAFAGMLISTRIPGGNGCAISRRSSSLSRAHFVPLACYSPPEHACAQHPLCARPHPETEGHRRPGCCPQGARLLTGGQTRK